MKFVQCSVVLLTFVLLLPDIADAQETKPASTETALFFGGGPGTVRSAALVAGISVNTRFGIFQGRAMTARETYALIPSRVPVEKNYDFGLLYGWQLPITSELSGLLSAGISSTAIVRRGEQVNSGGILVSAEYEALRTWIIGLPFELRLQLVEENARGGIFVALEGTLNSIDSYGGAMLGAFFWL